MGPKQDAQQAAANSANVAGARSLCKWLPHIFQNLGRREAWLIETHENSLCVSIIVCMYRGTHVF